MIATLDTAAAATLAGVSAAAVRRMCRTGAVTAAKVHGRWAVGTASLLHRLNRPLRRPADRLRKGEAAPQRTGRAARMRVGHHMSVARRHAVLDALCARVNGSRLTAAAFLRDALGADERFVRSYASPFGRAAAAAFRQAHGCEPVRDGLARQGRRLVGCFTYDAAALAAGAAAYSRTAELLAA